VRKEQRNAKRFASPFPLLVPSKAGSPLGSRTISRSLPKASSRNPLSFERRYFSQPLVPTDGLDLVAKELAQRTAKLRDFATNSVVDLQSIRELEQSGVLKT